MSDADARAFSGKAADVQTGDEKAHDLSLRTFRDDRESAMVSDVQAHLLGRIGDARRETEPVELAQASEILRAIVAKDHR